MAFQPGRLFERFVDWNRSMEMLLTFSAAINHQLPPPALVQLEEQAAGLLNTAAGNHRVLGWRFPVTDRPVDVVLGKPVFDTNREWPHG